MALRAGRVGVRRDQVDPSGKITAGGLTPEQSAKLSKALVSPVSAPSSNELVGVGTGNEQIRVQIGDGLEISGDTSPFTLKALGGSSFSIVETATTLSTVEGNAESGPFTLTAPEIPSGKHVVPIWGGFKFANSGKLQFWLFRSGENRYAICIYNHGNAKNNVDFDVKWLIY